MSTNRTKDILKTLSDRQNLWKLANPRANRNHPTQTSRFCACNNIVEFFGKIREV
jgi:hypothetical protein